MLRPASSVLLTRKCAGLATAAAANLRQTTFVAKEEVDGVCERVREILQPVSQLMQHLTHYHFDSKGKAVRPLLCSLLSAAHNTHWARPDAVTATSFAPTPAVGLLPGQRCVATVAEMIHVASLIHDDLIDRSSTRRGRPSVHCEFGPRRAVLAGDFILSQASVALARLRNEDVVRLMAQIIEDLIRGEFMQLGSRENESERFSHYLKKTYHKTASLMANSCKSAAILSVEAVASEASAANSQRIIESAFQFGRHIGLAFQLVDDALDFSASAAQMGKPTGADLQLGLATGPVLFAAQEFPELGEVIMRRFSEAGDVQLTLELVQRSDGIAQTHLMAETHVRSALSELSLLRTSSATEELRNLARSLLTRSS